MKKKNSTFPATPHLKRNIQQKKTKKNLKNKTFLKSKTNKKFFVQRLSVNLNYCVINYRSRLKYGETKKNFCFYGKRKKKKKRNHTRPTRNFLKKLKT